MIQSELEKALSLKRNTTMQMQKYSRQLAIQETQPQLFD
jgi:hypothetical protein